MEVTLTCPLGHECEYVAEGKMNRCSWYLELAGIEDGKVTNERRCTMAWQTVLLLDHSKDNRHQTAAVESVRNLFYGAAQQNVKSIKNS
jgi:hypothetical protein